MDVIVQKDIMRYWTLNRVDNVKLIALNATHLQAAIFVKEIKENLIQD